VTCGLRRGANPRFWKWLRLGPFPDARRFGDSKAAGAPPRLAALPSSPIHTVFLDGIVRAVETGSYATHRSDEGRISAALTCSRGPHPLLVLYTNVGRFDINA